MTKKFRCTPECDRCGVRKELSYKDEIPPMVGFEFQDGKMLNLCCDCISFLGELVQSGNDEGVRDFWNEILLDHPELEHSHEED